MEEIHIYFGLPSAFIHDRRSLLHLLWRIAEEMKDFMQDLDGGAVFEMMPEEAMGALGVHESGH